MKKICFWLALPVVLLAVSCEEKMIVVPDLTVGARRVLVEELTGVKCQNCPDGARKLTALQNSFGKEKLVVVSIHAAGSLSNPYSYSQYDLQTDEGYELVEYVGQAEAFPSAAISRYQVPGNTSIYLFPAEWESVIAQEFAKDFQLGVFLTHSYDPASRRLDIQVNMTPDRTLPGENRLTVLLTQDSIVDVQLDGADIKSDYIHRHVLRDVVSKPDGDVLGEPLNAGAVVVRNYSVVLDPSWEEKHISIVAFVHHGGDPDREVLQVTEAHLIE
jgi:hypothetical protein